MGGRTVKIKLCILTIEKGEKKMGRRTVEIKFYVFTIEKGEKKDGWTNGGNQILYIYYRKR